MDYCSGFAACHNPHIQTDRTNHGGIEETGLSKADRYPFVAAVDLGSNSFHMIVARRGGDGTPSVVDRLREPVRLADRLQESGSIHRDAARRALDCLARFGQRLRDFPRHCVRAVGTNTMRRANDAISFRRDAEAALGHRIEVISGIEEARLIYSGVSLDRAPEKERRLVFDIGGGSTEVIAGRGLQPTLLESLSMGCVVFSDRYFPKGKVSEKNWDKAVLAAGVKLEPIAKRYLRHGWDRAIGCSGTIRAVQNIIAAEKLGHNSISRKGLALMAEKLLEAGHVENLNLNGLREDRRAVLPGGMAILYALFKSLELQELELSDRALRDGLLMDLIGRLTDSDVRSASVTAMATRYDADTAQATAVAQTALELLRQSASHWDLDRKAHGMLLHWAAQLNETGLAIAHAAYNVHSAYLAQHSDLAGFSQSEQRQVATLIRLHRGKLDTTTVQNLADEQRDCVLRLVCLLRLAVILNRDRSQTRLPRLKLGVVKDNLSLHLPARWLQQHPLTRADLEKEQEHLAAIGYRLRLE